MSSAQIDAQRKLVSLLLQEDPDLLEVVQEFVTGLDSRLAEMKEAHAKLDWDMLTTLAHRLKGAGGSYGYPDISRICADMEQNFRAHQAGDFGAQLSQLRDLISAARQGLPRQ